MLGNYFISRLDSNHDRQRKEVLWLHLSIVHLHLTNRQRIKPFVGSMESRRTAHLVLIVTTCRSPRAEGRVRQAMISQAKSTFWLPFVGRQVALLLHCAKRVIVVHLMGRLGFQKCNSVGNADAN